MNEATAPTQTIRIYPERSNHEEALFILVLVNKSWYKSIYQIWNAQLMNLLHNIHIKQTKATKSLK
jgi:hypothetical protein